VLVQPFIAVMVSVADEKKTSCNFGISYSVRLLKYRVWRCEDWTAEMWTTSHGRCQVSLQTD